MSDAPAHAPMVGLERALPPGSPRLKAGFGQRFGRWLLRMGGWRLAGEFPDERKLMIIVAPHSSGWDAIWGLAMKLALGVDVAFMAKQELFRGPLGWLLRRLGGFGVNRRSTAGVVEQVVARYRERDQLWLVIAPEGTRRRVEHWKSGFWRIARDAQVPVLCAYFHYPDRVIGIGPLLHTTDSLEADMARVREFYRPWIGRNRGTI